MYTLLISSKFYQYRQIYHHNDGDENYGDATKMKLSRLMMMNKKTNRKERKRRIVLH